ncbi:MAG: hypothetical protein ACKO80_06170 [Acidimicrobiaceae bacterium]
MASSRMYADVVFFFVSLAVSLGVSLNFVAISLLALAAGLAALTVWFWITARPEPEALAPLEIMSQSEFAQSDEETRKQMLNAVRAMPVIATPPVAPASAAQGTPQTPNETQ